VLLQVGWRRCSELIAGNIGNALSGLSARAVNSVIATAAIVVGRAGAVLSAGIHRPIPGLHVTREPAVTKLGIGQIWWLSGLGILFGILVFAAHSSPWTVGDLPLAGRLGALVTCVLPAGTDDPSSLATTGSETSVPDCESPALDRLYAPRLTAC